MYLAIILLFLGLVAGVAGVAVMWSWSASIIGWAAANDWTLFCTQWMFQSPFQVFTWHCENAIEPVTFGLGMLALGIILVPVSVFMMVGRRMTAMFGILILMVGILAAFYGSWTIWDHSNSLINWVISKDWRTFCSQWFFTPWRGNPLSFISWNCWQWSQPMDLGLMLITLSILVTPVGVLMLSPRKTIKVGVPAGP